MIEDNVVKLDFTFYVNNASYDNDDNPYGKLAFHMYTNMKDISDRTSADKDLEWEFEDRIIPVKECDTDYNDFWSSNTIKQYCPDYDA